MAKAKTRTGTPGTLLPAPPEAKWLWEMTQEEFAANAVEAEARRQALMRPAAQERRLINAARKRIKLGDLGLVSTSGRTTEWSTLVNAWRRGIVHLAVEEGKLVPRAVLEDYKEEPWAYAALARARGKEWPK